MDLELRALRYFVAVAETLNFSKAAARLNISQPPLSLAIRQLEEKMGAQLFERNSRHVSLTPAGAVLYKEALFLISHAGSLKIALPTRQNAVACASALWVPWSIAACQHYCSYWGVKVSRSILSWPNPIQATLSIKLPWAMLMWDLSTAIACLLNCRTK